LLDRTSPTGRLPVLNLDRRLLKHVLSAPRDLAAAIVLNLVGAAGLVWQARLLSRVISRVFLDQAALSQSAALLITFLALAFLRALVAWQGDRTAVRAAGRVKIELRRRLVTHLFALGPAYVKRERSGELTNVLTEGIEALDAYLGQYLPQLVLAALIPLTMLLFVLPLDPLSGLVLLLTAPLIPFFMILIGSGAASVARRQWGALSRMSAHLLDILQGLTTLKALSRSRDQIKVIRHVSDQYRDATLDVLRVAFLSALVLELVATISTAIVAVQIGLRLLAGRIAFEEAFFILLLAPEFYLPLRMLSTRFHSGTAGVAAAQRIFQILETAAPASRSTPIRGLPVPPMPAPIRFEGVFVHYRDRSQPALADLTLEIPPGTSLALVGPSGSGKSTLTDLLLRFIDPDRGTITVAQTPLYDISADAWLQHIAWVPQAPHLFAGTIMENLRLARPAASVDEVVWATRQAEMDEFIQRLPLGYDTPIGELGTRLSGGQAQRLALARAFLKDAPLIILDEPTAYLDPELEDRVRASIRRLMTGRTTLIIAHRLTTVQNCDQIVVLEAGRVVEAGSHQALMDRAGLYYDLVTNYRVESADRP
jgi:ATP-binding cassette subfamily C protein CydD